MNLQILRLIVYPKKHTFKVPSSIFSAFLQMLILNCRNRTYPPASPASAEHPSSAFQRHFESRCACLIATPGCGRAVIRNGSDTYFKLPPLKLQCHYHTAVFGRDGKGRRGREVHKSRECSSQKVGLKPPLQPALQGAQLINVIVYRDFHFFFWA